MKQKSTFLKSCTSDLENLLVQKFLLKFSALILLFCLVTQSPVSAQSFHTVTFTGNSTDFNTNNNCEYYGVVSNVAYYCTYDASNIYIGAFRTGGNSFGSSDNLTIYLDSDPSNPVTGGTGTTAGQSYNGVTGTLPFTANYNVHAEQSYQEARSFGSTWASTISGVTYYTSSTCREVKIPFSSIGNPTGLYMTLWLGYAGGTFSPFPTANATGANPTETNYIGYLNLTSTGVYPLCTTNTVIPSCTAGTWTGTTSTDWNTASNWCGGTIPTSSTNITITSVPANQPVIGSTGSTAVANSIIINSGATLTMNGSVGLNITSGGTITNNGTFNSSTCPTATVNFLGSGTIGGSSVCNFPNLTFTGQVTLNKGINITGNFVAGTQQINNGNTVTFAGSCSGGQTITKTGGGTEYFSKVIINKSAGNVVLSNSPATNATIDDPMLNNASGTTLTINNAGGLDINGQIFTINGGGGTNPRAAILVDGVAGGVTKTIKSTIADGTFNIRGTFVSGLAGVEVNSANSGKLLFDNYVNVNTNIGFAPTDVTTIGYKLELLGVSSYNGGFVTDVNNTSGANGHPVYAVGSALIYNNVVGVPFDRNREWDASGVQTAGTTPGYPYNVIIKGNSKVDIGINTTSGIDNRAIANDLTIESGSTLDMNVMDQTGHHLTIGRNITLAGTLKLGHGTTANNPFAGDILVAGNWTRTGSSSVLDANETGSGYTAVNQQKVISDVVSNIKARAVTFFGTNTSTVSGPVLTGIRDVNGGFGGETFPYLKINKSTSGTLVINASPLTITRELFLTQGTLQLGDSNIVLASNKFRTADVAQIPASGVVITYPSSGRFVAQRFIYNATTQRSWRFLTAPLQASDPLTINDAWQEGMVNPDKTMPSSTNPWPSVVTDGSHPSWCGIGNWPGFGTHITGPGGTYNSTAGFDQGTNTYSIQYYNNSGATSVWTVPANTKSTALMSKLAWGLFVRGDRGFVIGNQYVPAATTILEPKGKINTGDITSAVLSGKINLVGNPYPAQINMTNVSVGGATKQNFKLWDPLAFNGYTQTGKYIPFAWSSGTTYTSSNSPVTNWSYPGTVESSEAFFVNPATSSVVFHETDKVNGVSTLNGIQSRPAGTNNTEVNSLFRTYLAFFDSTASKYTKIDGTLNMFNPTYKNAVDDFEDVISALSSSATGSIRILKDGYQLSIDKEQNIISADTVFLYLSPLKKIRHQLILTSSDFIPDVKAYLEDKYLSVVTPITIGDTDTTFYDFEITSDPQSNRADRFRVVLNPISSAPLPVNFITLKATQRSGAIAIEWKVANEDEVKEYQVERSSDGISFSTLGIVTGSPVTLKTWIDKLPFSGDNYYRICLIDRHGSKNYSTTIRANISTIHEPGISVYPNPVVDGVVGLQMNNMPKGIYRIKILNPAGQTLLNKTINHAGGFYSETLKPSQISSGVSVLEVSGGNQYKKSINLVRQ